MFLLSKNYFWKNLSPSKNLLSYFQQYLHLMSEKRSILCIKLYILIVFWNFIYLSIILVALRGVKHAISLVLLECSTVFTLPLRLAKKGGRGGFACGANCLGRLLTRQTVLPLHRKRKYLSMLPSTKRVRVFLQLSKNTPLKYKSSLFAETEITMCLQGNVVHGQSGVWNMENWEK